MDARLWMPVRSTQGSSLDGQGVVPCVALRCWRSGAIQIPHRPQTCSQPAPDGTFSRIHLGTAAHLRRAGDWVTDRAFVRGLGFPRDTSTAWEAHQILTVVSIGAGVGLAMAVGATRLSSGATRLPLWRLVSPLALLCLLSTCVTPPAAQGLAWDAGAVTTGPCEVPSRPLALSPPSHPVALSLAYRSDHGPRHSRARRRLCPRERLGLWSRGPRLSLPGAVNRVQLLLDQAVCGRT